MRIKKEFKVKKFTLHHEDREKFSKPNVSLRFLPICFCSEKCKSNLS